MIKKLFRNPIFYVDVGLFVFAMAALAVATAPRHSSLGVIREALAAAISGVGTTNKVAAFSDSSTLGDSIISDDGTTVTIGGTTIPASSIRMNVNGHLEVSGNATSNADIKLNSLTRPTIYPWGSNVTGAMGLQVRSAGTGLLQLNADNSGLVSIPNGVILGNTTGATCNSANTGMLAANITTDKNLWYCNGSAWQRINP